MDSPIVSSPMKLSDWRRLVGSRDKRRRSPLSFSEWDRRMKSKAQKDLDRVKKRISSRGRRGRDSSRRSRSRSRRRRGRLSSSRRLGTTEGNLAKIALRYIALPLSRKKGGVKNALDKWLEIDPKHIDMRKLKSEINRVEKEFKKNAKIISYLGQRKRSEYMKFPKSIKKISKTYLNPQILKPYLKKNNLTATKLALGHLNEFNISAPLRRKIEAAILAVDPKRPSVEKYQEDDPDRLGDMDFAVYSDTSAMGFELPHDIKPNDPRFYDEDIGTRAPGNIYSPQISFGGSKKKAKAKRSKRHARSKKKVKKVTKKSKKSKKKVVKRKSKKKSKKSKKSKK